MPRAETYTGKHALITGGASGLGLAFAHQLKAQGAHVTLLDMAAPIPGFTCKQCDVRDAAALATIINKAEAEHGPIDPAIASAAIDMTGHGEQFTAEDWRNIIETNLIGCTNLVAALYPKMVERRAGQLILISSGAGLIGFPLGAPYTATKSALIGMAAALRAEAARYNVRVSVACPPILDTPILEGAPAKPGINRPAFLKTLQKTPMPADEAAMRILKAAAKNKSPIIFPASLSFAHKLATLFPKLGDAICADILKRFDKTGRE